MLIQYKAINFTPGSKDLIDKANVIIAEYEQQGFDLTLRQLYYQFVARDFIENKQSEYKRLGSVINDARLAGLISWKSIVDRTRNLQSNGHWDSPADIVDSCVRSYQIDKWRDQATRVEVWIEKDALVGVIENVCVRNDVPYFSCRGYTSQSEMWSAGQRLQEYIDVSQNVVIIHLGDHDPSGIDMSRDIEDRLRMFLGLSHSNETLTLNRIALNMDQVRKYKPPPNPTKLTDSRATPYIKQFGNKSWELDALDPRTLDALIDSVILESRDDKAWNASVKEENAHKKSLAKAAKALDE